MDPQLGIKSELSPLVSAAGNAILGSQQSHQSLLGPTSPSSMKMSINCDKRENAGYWMGGGPGATESGFINSQPSMAEFLTQIDPESPKMFPMVSPSDSGGGMDGVPEYPWMKEKKTARKNSATQGEHPNSRSGSINRGGLTISILHSLHLIDRESSRNFELFVVNLRG